VKRAMRGMGKMLRFWGGGDSSTPAPPDVIEADIIDDNGQVVSAAPVPFIIASRSSRSLAAGRKQTGGLLD
jgi:hypothetical protein